MKNRLSEGVRNGIGFLAVFMTVLLMLCSAYPVYGATVDLLLLPAEKFEGASSYMLTDVVNVNGRMVAVGERGHILYTDDEKCQGWIQADVPVSLTLTSVYFPTDEKGWAVGHDGIVLHTKDGGKTWEKQLDGTKINKLMLEQVKTLIKSKKTENEEEGLAEDLVAESIKGGSRQALARLEDWSFFLRDLEMASREGPIWPLMDVWFKNDREGIVVGSFGIILGTTDGGKTWEPRLESIDNQDAFHYYAIARSGNDLFIGGESGMLFRSEDDGRTWQRLESPYDGSYFGITGDPNGGFVTAYGLRGNAYYSLDRGETWHFASTGTKATLSGGTMMSDGTLCLVAVDGSILISGDKGKTFSPLPKRFLGSIGVTEVKRGVITVVGLRGVAQFVVNKASSKN